MIWLAEARGRLSALSGVIRNCTHKNHDTPGKLVGNKQERFVLILYSDKVVQLDRYQCHKKMGLETQHVKDVSGEFLEWSCVYK